MKVLHIGHGFWSWRGGGLIEYAEDLMDIQVAKGYEVGYFFAGRFHPIVRKPWLKKWLRKNISMYEVINSIVAKEFEQKTNYPEVDMNEEYSEKFFLQVLSEFNPDIIHIQELFAIPSSLIEIIKVKKIPVLMTLHDYFPLCPTLNLYDHNNSLCLEPNIGNKCQLCHTQRITSSNYFIDATIEYEKRQSGLLKKIVIKTYNKLRKIRKLIRKDTKPSFSKTDGLNDRFQKRRDTNVERLNKMDLLIGVSCRVSEMYRVLGVQESKIITVNPTVKHIDDIKPKNRTSIYHPINFATSNGLVSRDKGAYLILDTLRKLKEAGLTSQFRLFVMGGLLDEIKNELLQFDNVVYKGSYDVADLNKLLEEIHLGIVPSVWEEPYGLVGIEFLSKGIPVIGNKIGGIVDYTVENVTGWLNEANTAEGLAQIITDIVHNPNQVLHLNQSIISNYPEIIKSMDRHFEEMDKIYRALIQSTLTD